MFEDIRFTAPSFELVSGRIVVLKTKIARSTKTCRRSIDLDLNLRSKYGANITQWLHRRGYELAPIARTQYNRFVARKTIINIIEDETLT